jgi:hypothetical protein
LRSQADLALTNPNISLSKPIFQNQHPSNQYSTKSRRKSELLMLSSTMVSLRIPQNKLPITDILIAAAAHFNPDPTAISIEDFSKSLSINVASVYAAGKEAVAGFATLPADATKTFIYTGNILNRDTRPVLVDLGVGKSAAAHLIEAWTLAYRNKGYQ